MSTSNVLPVLRTCDLSDAYRAVRRLLGLVVPMDGFRVSAFGQVLAVAEAERLVAAFPEGVIIPDEGPESSDETRAMVVAGDPRVAGMLPLRFYLDDCPVGSIEEAFLGVVGAGAGWIEWDWFSWPAVPELGLGMRNKDACLQIAINSRDVTADVPAADHTVFIHFRSGDVERAEWLARQVGLRGIGPVEMGW
ncbi:hypothetical protein ACFYST_19765 [Kitasatospora sp. NPDC004614]|uniref:hypothetical protein n=1 Tax=unclassified Kitasatospora TaxID=2633591 RepID=UPI00369AD8FF